MRYLFFGILCLMVACTPKEKFEHTLGRGFPFQFHINESGESPLAGDEVLYRMYVRKGDSVINKSHEDLMGKKPFSKAVLPPENVKIVVPPHLEVMQQLSPGDSITLYYPLDTMKRVPPIFEGEKYIYYDIVMVDFSKAKPKVKKEAKPLPIDDYEVTPNGYPVVFHRNEAGDTPKLGEYIYFRMYIRNDDKVIFSTAQNKRGTETFKSAQFTLTNNPPPQMDAFSIMSPGDSLTLYYQIDTLDKKPQGFENSDMVYYDIVLLEIKDQAQQSRYNQEKRAEKEAEKQAIRDREPAVEALLKKTIRQYKAGELDMRIRTAASGLKYMILELGNGSPIQTSNYVLNHFMCMMEDERMFGSSYPDGEPLQVLVGSRTVIPGWETGLRLLKEGSKAVFFVPPALAYGAEGVPGQVPPNAELIFYVDVAEVR